MKRPLYFCILLFAAATLWGQGSVTIFGTITDSTGAVLPNIAVTVANTQTGAVRQTVSTAAGTYVVSQLPVGTYSVRVEASGFKTFVQDNIRAQMDENRQVNIQMALGGVTESIEVQAEITQVETRSGALREVVDSARIVELPLNGRNAIQLQYMVPGTGGRAAAGQAQNESVSINGTRTNSNNYSLDGGDNHDPYFNTPSVFPNPDALEEFSVQTSSYGADKGRNAGAFVNAVTRSGTNVFHGTLFEFLRNEKLNARNFFANNVPPFKRSQFGGTIGGPVVKDKTFFFFTYQRTAERSTPGSVTSTVLTEPQRKGDFTGLNKVLKDPLGGNIPNNIIPASRLYAPSVKFLDAFVPLPNRPQGLLTFASGQTRDNDQYVGKADHRLSDADQLSGRLLYSFDDFAQETGNIPGFLAGIKYWNWNAAATHTHIFSPTVLNSFTFSFDKIDRRQLPIVPGNKSWIDLGAKFTRAVKGDYLVGHDTALDGYFQAFSRFPLNHFRQSWQFSELLSLTRGSHFVRFGGDLRRSLLDMQELFQCDPQVRFGANYTGDSAPDFLLGRPRQITQIAQVHNQPRTTEIGVFAQDDWKISRRLTLNLGLRWDPFFPFSDAMNTFSQVRVGQKSTVFPVAPAGIVFSGDSGVPNATIKNQWGNFGPRFGFAIDPTGAGKASVRGGYGLFYSQVRQQANNQVSTNQPFSIKLIVNTPTGGLENPYSESGNPFPFTPPQSAQEKAAYKFLTPLTVTEWDPDFRNAIVQQWNLSLQRQFFGSYIASVAYVGSKGNHLFMANELNPGIYAPGGRPLDQRRPLYPTFATISDQASFGNSIYHSLQLSLNKRLSKGLTILANYTFAKLIDDSSGDGSVPSNPFSYRNQRGPGDFDIPHRFIGSYIWQLPKLERLHPLLRHVVGSWETNGLVTLESGRPFSVTSGRDNSGSGMNADRADVAGDPHLDTGRPRAQLIDRYFNTAAFAQNPAGTFGTSGRNILRDPGTATVDFGMIKGFPIHERHRLQFRAEMFNLFNRVNLGRPNANQSAATFGRITGADSPRVIQLALKYMF
ncbi:MAG: TonB-dependent receptor [Bryobacterales bacterium]|nr:TonB-dependent receptor [Bryobacterales bacterium]